MLSEKFEHIFRPTRPWEYRLQIERTILILTIIFVISCAGQNENKFSLTGKTKGMGNGTILLLENSQNGEIIDSVTVENNRFKFHKPLATSPLQVILRTEDSSKYRFIWLENSKMTFDATKLNFRDALVNGSDTENQEQDLRRQLRGLKRQERLSKEMEFLKSHPDSIVSAYILSVYSTTWGKENTSELFENFSEEIKETEYGKNIANYIRLNKNPKIGEQFIDFSMKDINGKMGKLSDLKNKIVLLEFWSSGCGACRIENPNLVKTYREFKSLGFEIFAVSLDTRKENWLKAIEKDGLPWLQVSDLKGHNNSASLIYGINGIPDNFLIDKNGIIIGRNLRGEKLNKKLSEIMPAADNVHIRINKSKSIK